MLMSMVVRHFEEMLNVLIIYIITFAAHPVGADVCVLCLVIFVALFACISFFSIAYKFACSFATIYLLLRTIL
jgi:hypothetical protein